MTTIQIGPKTIGQGHPALIVAELGINHNGDLDTALRMVRAAADAGADACKVQCFHAEEFCTDDVKYRGERQVEMFKRYELQESQFRAIRDECHKRGVLFFGTPMDNASVDMLVRLEAPCIKIGSDDIVHHDLLRYVGGKGLPVLLSTGMADGIEIHEAFSACLWRRVPVVLMHCTSLYPTPPQAVRLARMNQLRERYGALARNPVDTRDTPVLVGYSDHTRGLMACAHAAAMGACVLEKHFTLSREMDGPDHGFSLDEWGLRMLVELVRDAEQMRGSGGIGPTPEELEMRKLARRSIVAARTLPLGTVLERRDLALKRPGTGLMPYDMDKVLGKTLARGVARDELITEGDLG